MKTWADFKHMSFKVFGHLSIFLLFLSSLCLFALLSYTFLKYDITYLTIYKYIIIVSAPLTIISLSSLTYMKKRISFSKNLTNNVIHHIKNNNIEFNIGLKLILNHMRSDHFNILRKYYFDDAVKLGQLDKLYRNKSFTFNKKENYESLNKNNRNL